MLRTVTEATRRFYFIAVNTDRISIQGYTQQFRRCGPLLIAAELSPIDRSRRPSGTAGQSLYEKSGWNSDLLQSRLHQWDDARWVLPSE
jgi:hypothetical protein